MSNLLVIVILTVLQFAAGFGILTLFNLWLKPGIFLPLALLLGIAIFSIIPFLLQLVFIPLTPVTIFSALLLTSISLNLKFRNGIIQFKKIWKLNPFKIRIYEEPFLIVFAFLVFLSVWRCFYYPPFPRDLVSGAEVIAEYAIKEKTLINSVFTVDLTTTNNPFKSPFITCLQVIYKMAGFPFGQIWLSTVFISFLIFLYHFLSIKLHRLIAGVLTLFFLAIPELYAYSFMVLYDYSNAVYFCLSVFFLFEYFKNDRQNYLVMSALLMGMATYIRSETLVLAFMMLPVLVWHLSKKRSGWSKPFKAALSYLWPSILFYFLTVTIYINYYLPLKYKTGELVNQQLTNLRPLFQRLMDMSKEFIFSQSGINYYGYFMYVFLALLLLDLGSGILRNTEAKNWLYAVIVVYFGLAMLGYLLPLFDLDNSTKRGLFKIFPLMLLYMANSNVLIDISERIKKWELKGLVVDRKSKKKH